jgi:multidrug efflux pump subunit AcrA (membrane-fusion protein)
MYPSKSLLPVEDESSRADRRRRGNQLAASRITFISPQVDNTTQTVLAKAQIANSNDSVSAPRNSFARAWSGAASKSPLCRSLPYPESAALYFAFVAEPDQKGGYVVHQKPLQIGQIVAMTM